MKKIYAIIVAVVVFGFLIIPNAQAQPLIPKINNSAAPVPPVSGCVGEDLTFGGSTAQNFPLAAVTYPVPRWTVTGPGTLTNANTNNVTYNCATPGTFVLTYSAIKLGITYSVSVNVTTVDKDLLILDLPASFPYSICEGSSITLQASGPTDYYWEREMGAVIDPIGVTASVTDTPPVFGVWTYRVYGSSAGCATIPDFIQFQITADQAVTVNPGGPYTTCSGIGVTLNGSITGPIATGIWSGGLGTFTPSANALNAVYTPHASESGLVVNLTLTSDDPPGVCDFKAVSTTVTVTPSVGLPIFTLGATSIRCQGAGNVTYSATATNNTGIIYTLDALSLAGGNTINAATGEVTYAAGWTGTSTITATASGCSGPTVANHTVTITPTVGTPIFVLGLTSTRCQGAGSVTYTATATNSTGITYTLDAASIAGGNTINAATGQVTYAAGWSGTSIITATATGCSGPSIANHTVTITPTVGLPVFLLGLTSTRCQGAGNITYTATATNSTGITYTLDAPSLAGGNTINAATGEVTYVATWSGTTRITARATGCNGPRNRIHTVTVTPTVGTPIFVLGAISTRCQGAGSVTYTATATNSTGISYTLDAASLAGGNTINAATGQVTYTAGWTGTSIISATATGCNGPTNANHTVTITPSVGTPIFILGASSTRCQGAGSITYTAAATNSTGITYTLDAASLAGGNTINAATGQVTYTAGWNGSSTITATAAGCSGPTNADHTVTVTATIGIPVFVLGASSTRCQGAGNVTYTATATSSTGMSYALDALSLAGGNTINAVSGQVTYTAGWTGTSIITATATGCSGPTTANHTVTITPSVGIPVFTLGLTSSRCQGIASVTYTATATNTTGITYTLDAASIAGGNTINAATGQVTYTAGWNGTSTITASAAGCSGPTLSVHTVTINTIPAVTFGGVLANQCANATTYLLTGGTPVGGAYTGPGVVNPNFNASVAGVGMHTITYTYSDGTCSNFATNTITVNPIIIGNTISTVIPAICYNANAALTGLVPTGGDGVTYTYKWQSSTAGAGGPFTDILDANSTNQNYTSVAGITQNTWYRRLVSSGPCLNDISNVIQITVGPIFTVGTTFTTPKCVGSNDGTATANPVGGTPIPPLNTYTYSWDTSPIQITKTATGLIAGTYTVTVTDNIGCIAVGTAIITNPTPLTLGLPTVVHVSGCFGGNNGSIQILAAGGTSPYKYDLYNNGAFVATQTVAGAVTFTQPTTPITASTLYEIRVTDFNGCGPVLSGDITVNQPVEVDFTYTKLDVLCNGSLTGEIHFTPSGGTPPYQYSVDDGFTWGNNPDFFMLPSGNYDLKVRDAILCESTTIPEEIIEPEQIITNGGTWKNITSCFNDNKGEIDVTVLGGGTPPYEFSIDAGATWQSTGLFQNLFAGNYIIIVRDASGCTVNVGPIPITQPTQITFTETVTNVITCWYNLNGSIRVNAAAGGKSPRTTSIDNITYYTIPHLFPALGIGNQTIYVKDANGCIATKIISITGPTPITLVAPPTVVDLTCNGVLPANGEIHVSAIGGTGALTYRLDGGAYQGTGDFVGLTAGDHSLDVKDANNCIFNQTITVSEPPAIVFTTEEKKDITCFGVPANGTITLQANGGTGALTYTFNPGALTSTPGAGLPAIFPNLAAGSYSYFVTDIKGCTTPLKNLDINEPLDITIITNPQVDINCSGGTGLFSVDASGGTGALVYNLYDNAHTLVTTNGDGEFPISVAGTYTVEVTDANGCVPKITPPLTFTSPSPIIIDNQVFTQMTGVGANDGTITIQASGGTGALHYTLTTLNPLNPMAGTTLTPGAGIPAPFTGLSADTYTVVITDDVPCSKSAPPVVIGQLDLTLTPTQISCNGLNDGQIVLTVNGIQNPPYTIMWDNNGVPLPAYTDSFTIGPPLGPGTYTANVADGTGVTGSATVTLNDPLVFDASILSVNEKQCFGGANGSVTFNIIGGSTPYTITWTEGGTPRTEIVNTPPYIATNVIPGTYSFTITSAAGCGSETITDVVLTDPGQLSITEIVWKNPCFGETNGNIIVTATGGTTPLTYSIVGTVNATNSDGIFNNLPIGNYTVSLTDANSCPESHDPSISLIVSLTENPQINIAVVPPAFLQCSYSLGTIDITVTGGSPILPGNSYNYSWNTIPAITTEDLSASQGTYTVTATDAIGCTENQSATINGPNNIAITAPTIVPAKCSSWLVGNVDVGSITLGTVSGGTGPYNYFWSYPVGSTTTGNVLSGLSGGRYPFRIVDANNCIYRDTITVPSDPNFFMNAYISKDTMLCGSASFDLTAFHNGLAEPPRTYTYKWYDNPLYVSPLQVGSNNIFRINPTVTSKYYLQIENEVGCASRDDVDITIYPKIGLSIPFYVKGLEQDTIITLLYGSALNLDAITKSTLYPTKFNWTPKELFTPDTSWNSSIFITEEIYALLPKVQLKQNPAINRLTDFIKFKVRAVTSKGCKDSLYVYAKMLSNSTVGNVFSPNGDGTNDIWTVPKQYFFPDLSIEIFNRWGALVWSATGDKAVRGWDGRTNNGKELPIGTYYYIVKYNIKTSDGNWKPETGSITIVR